MSDQTPAKNQALPLRQGLAQDGGGGGDGDDESNDDEAAEEGEEVWDNTLFVALRERVSKFEQQASELGWHILVPTQASLAAAGLDGALTMSVLRRHVVHESPYLLGEYVNFCGDRLLLEGGRVVLVRDSRERVMAADRYKVLAEESCFGSSGSYKVLSIDRPLAWDGQSGEAVLPPESTPVFPEDGTPVFDDARPVDEWMFVLNRDRKNSAALRKLVSFTENLRHSYVLVANKVGIADFARKMNVNIESAVDALVADNRARFGLAASNKRLRAMLRRVVEAFAFLGVHDMVFGALAKFYHEQEVRILAQLRSHKDVMNSSAERNSVQFFEDLNAQRCPLAKLEFLRNYLRVSSLHEDFALNADNILSTLVDRLANLPADAAPRARVMANLQYMQNFHTSPIPNDLHYLLYQFRAAICYLAGTEDLTEIDAAPRILAHPGPRIFRDSRARSSDSAQGELPPSTTASASKDAGAQASSTKASVADGVVIARTKNENGDESDDAAEDVDEEEYESSDDGESSDGDSQDAPGSRASPSLGGFLTALMRSDADVVSSSR